jgi:hypothetical protein
MEIKFRIDESAIVPQIQAAATQRVSDVSHRYVRDHFVVKDGYSQKTDGPGTEIIKGRIDEFLLSKDVNRMIDSAVERHLNEAISRLAKAYVDHSIGKIVFSGKHGRVDMENLRELLKDAIAGQE